MKILNGKVLDGIYLAMPNAGRQAVLDFLEEQHGPPSAETEPQPGAGRASHQP